MLSESTPSHTNIHDIDTDSNFDEHDTLDASEHLVYLQRSFQSDTPAFLLNPVLEVYGA